jgi:hypothetical protein
MNQSTPKYYTPYDSGEDTGDDTDNDDELSEDYDSEDLPDFEDARIRREEDPRYAIIRTAGPNFNTSALQLKYMENAPGASYDISTNITNLSSLVYLNPPKTTKSSLLTIKSLNRDTSVYPSPFYFQLKTPRVYKNVTKLQLVQVSFPNNTTSFINSPSFEQNFITALLNQGLSPECISTCLTLTGCNSAFNSVGVVEKGRVADGYPKMYSFSIPSGNYTNEEIAEKLNIAANNTPPLNLISYADFKQEFQTHRDISILFNEPGDIYYSKVTSRHYTSYSKSDILHSYYPEAHINSFPVITDKIAFNAYYYPILKELMATNLSHPFLTFSPYTYVQVYDFVLVKFLGLDSDIYYDLCQNNLGSLEAFRKQLTFEHNPVNKYSWVYNSQIKQFSVIHNSLHTSLKADISQKYNNYFNNELQIRSLNNRSFQSLKSGFSNSNCVFQELHSYLSTQLFNYYHIENYQYSGGQLHGGLDATNILHSDPGFTSIFNFTKTFGKQFHSNFNGSTFTFTNFLDYHNTISTTYNTVFNTSSIISSIYGTTNNNHHFYVSTKYSNILPHSTIESRSYLHSQGLPVLLLGNMLSYSNGQSVTHPYIVGQSIQDAPPNFTSSSPSPCEAECCSIIERILLSYYGCLPTNSVIQNLAYRIGIEPLNFNFNFSSTILYLLSTTTFDVFLQLNPEQSFNNMDVSGVENYNVSNETTGQVKLMAAKLLLQGVGTGESSETAIQNPIIFDTPLGKLDKLTFRMYFDDKALTPLWLYIPFDLGINDWNATFQIDEEIAFANRDSGWGNNPTIPIPNNPDALQYMALTSTNNPNNK